MAYNRFEYGQNNYCSRQKTQKKLMLIEVHMYSVKAKSQAGHIWSKDITTT